MVGVRGGAQGGSGPPPRHPGSGRLRPPTTTPARVSAASARTQYLSFHQAGPWHELGPRWRLGLGTKSTKPGFFLPSAHPQEHREGGRCQPHGVRRGWAVGAWAAPHWRSPGIPAKLYKTERGFWCFFFFFNLKVFIFNWRTVAVLVSATHQHDSAVGTHVPSPSRSQAVRARDSSSLCHRANSRWLSNFTYGNVHIQRFSLGGPHRLLPRCAHKSVLQRTEHTAERTPNWGWAHGGSPSTRAWTLAVGHWGELTLQTPSVWEGTDPSGMAEAKRWRWGMTDDLQPEFPREACRVWRTHRKHCQSLTDRAVARERCMCPSHFGLFMTPRSPQHLRMWRGVKCRAEWKEVVVLQQRGLPGGPGLA